MNLCFVVLYLINFWLEYLEYYELNTWPHWIMFSRIKNAINPASNYHRKKNTC